MCFYYTCKILLKSYEDKWSSLYGRYIVLDSLVFLLFILFFPSSIQQMTRVWKRTFFLELVSEYFLSFFCGRMVLLFASKRTVLHDKNDSLSISFMLQLKCDRIWNINLSIPKQHFAVFIQGK